MFREGERARDDDVIGIERGGGKETVSGPAKWFCENSIFFSERVQSRVLKASSSFLGFWWIRQARNMVANCLKIIKSSQFPLYPSSSCSCSRSCSLGCLLPEPSSQSLRRTAANFWHKLKSFLRNFPKYFLSQAFFPDSSPKSSSELLGEPSFLCFCFLLVVFFSDVHIIFFQGQAWGREGEGKICGAEIIETLFI